MKARPVPAVSAVPAALAAFVLGCALTAPARAHHLDPAGGTAHGAAASPAAASAALPLYPGLGTWHHAVRTRSPLAQRYFDQGLRMLYAFNHDEAIAAFEEAGRLDTTCAMAPWGVALAYGPNINLPIDPDHEKAAYAALAHAQRLAPGASVEEREY